MATTWDLARMRSVIRKIVGKFDVTQLTDAEIDNYINDYYLFKFPEDMRTLKLKTWYEFSTVPNQATYDLPQTYFNVNPPIYVDGFQCAYYQDPELYYKIWPELNTIQNGIVTGDGLTTTYNFTLSATPVQPNTVIFGTPQESMTDDGAGNLISSLTLLNAGTIDYITGQVFNLTFVQPVPAGVPVNAHYAPYVASRPRDILFYNQQFLLKPIPNDCYRVKIECYVQPTTALGNEQFGGANPVTDLPLFTEWWQLLTYGAALEVFIEDSDHEQYDRHFVYYEKTKMEAQRRALKQLSTQRIQSPYTSNVGSPTWPIFPLY
jgi:hypothetical protein